MKGNGLGWLVLGLGTVLAGIAFQTIGLPAAWMVGPMLIAVVFALGFPKQRLMVPQWGRQASQAIVGGVLAAAFRPEVLSLLAKEWFTVSLMVGGTVFFSLIAGALLARMAHLDGRTAILGMLPGAASGMVMISRPFGADPRLVALAQYTRMVLVIASATLVARLAAHPQSTPDSSRGFGSEPSLAGDFLLQEPWMVYGFTAMVVMIGGWIGAGLLRLPAGALTGSLVLGVIVKELGVAPLGWPPIVPEVAYAVIGVYVGLLFDQSSVQSAKRVLPYVIFSTVGLIGVCAGLSLVLVALTGADLLTAYLAVTPGGIDSVAIMAVASEADASLVLTVQMLRLFAVVLVGTLISRLAAIPHR